jgi:hypothetical protein
MKLPFFIVAAAALPLSLTAAAQSTSELASALTLHASFDKELNADFSHGDRACYVRRGKEIVPAEPGDEAKVAPSGGRFGGALWFPKKGTTRPLFKGPGVLNYNAQSWSATVSLWLRLDPDGDLEPGYCDPVSIIGDDSKKGFIFLEWSKDMPRRFRYAIRPLFHIWNPTDVPWDEIPIEKRPMVQLEKSPFTREKWTHVAFTVDHVNDKTAKPLGRLYIDGQPRGAIENWDLTFAWDPAAVQLVLGASYVGYLDDLAVFNRALTDAEVRQVFQLKGGIADLKR